MKFQFFRKSNLVLWLFLGICGCSATEKQTDIGPGTFPSTLPGSTPNADEPSGPRSPSAVKTVRPTVTPANPGVINQSVIHQSVSED